MRQRKRRGRQPLRDYSSLAYIRVYPDGCLGEGEPIGYVFVIQMGRPDVRYKMPGGHKDPGEVPRRTACRETEAETGLKIPLDRFVHVDTRNVWHPSAHRLVLFTANIERGDVPWMHSLHPQNEGEQPKYFSVEQFRDLVAHDEFLPSHLERLQNAGLLPFGAIGN